MGTLAVMDQSGDTKVIWDKDNETEVETAREAFDKLKKKGYLAYAVKEKGEKGEVIHKFDREAEKIILAPQMRGG